jgi:hypothetical protein
MNQLFKRVPLISVSAPWLASIPMAKSEYDLRSPDNRIEVKIPKARPLPSLRELIAESSNTRFDRRVWLQEVLA